MIEMLKVLWINLCYLLAETIYIFVQYSADSQLVYWTYEDSMNHFYYPLFDLFSSEEKTLIIKNILKIWLNYHICAKVQIYIISFLYHEILVISSNC